MRFDIGRFADAAHFGVVAAIDEVDGGVRGLRLRHFLEQFLIAHQEGLGFRGQGRGAIQFRHHFPGRKIRAGPGVGASRDHHVRCFDQNGLCSFRRVGMVWGQVGDEV